jgi:signal transduction histidine kinase
MKQPRLRFTIANTDWDALRRSAQQEERRRIAQELHDTLPQGFTGIALKLDALATSLPPALSKAKQQLRQVLEQMDQYLGEMRHSIWNLCSPSLQRAQELSKALLAASERNLCPGGTRMVYTFNVPFGEWRCMETSTTKNKRNMQNEYDL